ncbi:netrin-B [Eupeodes corollae]|uniref:netrin-B n=1 Tax=Eupeodes corollae TaxID=290404 RepID=UPI00249106A2|nr:netrin-B [Eupeodes corollae]
MSTLSSLLVFLNILFVVIASDHSNDPCYSADGKGRKCVPSFVNAAYGNPVEASSTCGLRQPERYCEVDRNDRTTSCSVCDDANPELRYPASALTDLNNSNNVTCWRSASVPIPLAGDNSPPDNVTLTISLGKKYELTYVSLTFCPKSPRPDSMAIYKSLDHRKTWQPFQFYSSQCHKFYGRPDRAKISKFNEQEARCLSSQRTSGDIHRFAFNTLEGRPSANDIDSSLVLQDWVTATDIRVIFHRLDVPRDLLVTNRFGISMADGERKYTNDKSVDTNSAIETKFTGKLSAPLSSSSSSSSLSSTSTVMGTSSAAALGQHYAVSDFAVGGRCKCNGHASECVANGEDGQLVCDCKHNTAGFECERCKPFYFDRPWGRATDTDANECKICNCNGHARRCRFNVELYKLSGRVSGGVCYNCQHDTTGRYCHYCREGYYKDSTKPINHRKVCRRCDCHPVGSTGKVCNHISGQCPCKDGVTGQTCNRCAKGYQQTRSHVAPCIKIPSVINAIQAESASQSTDDSGNDKTDDMKAYCGKCKTTPKKLNLNRFCKEDYAIMAKVVGHDRASMEISTEQYSIERQNEIFKFEINIQAIFKRNPASGTTSALLGRGPMVLLVPRKNLECQCPKIKLNKSYLILGRDSEAAPGYLAVGPSSVVFEWKDEWSLRMKRFQRRSRKCS